MVLPCFLIGTIRILVIFPCKCNLQVVIPSKLLNSALLAWTMLPKGQPLFWRNKWGLEEHPLNNRSPLKDVVNSSMSPWMPTYTGKISSLPISFEQDIRGSIYRLFTVCLNSTETPARIVSINQAYVSFL